MDSVDPGFLEKIIIKSCQEYKHFLVLISNAFEPEYFDGHVAGKIFEFTRKHLEEYTSLPDRNVVINSLEEGIREDAKEFYQELDSIDFNISENYDWLLEESNKFLKDKALKRAIIQSVDIIDKDDEREKVREYIEAALCKDIKIDLGLNYWEDLGSRLRRILTSTDTRIPTGFGQFDEYITGGFPAFSFSVIVAEIHGFKTNTLINMAARQTAKGFNPVILTLEMSEDAYAQRFDSIYSLSDMNRMYLSSENIKDLARKLKIVKDSNGHGTLLIKQFPTGAASVRDFRIYLRELLIRDIKFNIIYVDYINLMMTAFKKGDGNLYITVKTIAEELRALSFEFRVPIVSVSQLNREGSFVDFSELSFNYIAESKGLPATCDFMAILGTSEEDLIYQSEVHYKIVKNRFGGRIGEVGKFYYDSRSLKMYDMIEENLWIQEASETGDERERQPEPEPRTGRGGRR